MNWAGRILATLLGLFMVWIAASFAIGTAFPAEGPLEPAIRWTAQGFKVDWRNWVGVCTQIVGGLLMGAFGVTLALAPWRRAK